MNPPSSHFVRYLSQSQARLQEEQTTTSSVRNFPWLLSKDSPRISAYPYKIAPPSWNLLNLLPKRVQHALSRWLGTRMLQLNTGYSYFPEQFLLGAGMATRHALEALSHHLSHPDEGDDSQLESMFGLKVLERFRDAAKKELKGAQVMISLPQIYDLNYQDVWVKLGSEQSFENRRNYEVVEWMTLSLGTRKAVADEAEESFADYRARTARSLMEGAQLAVDVEIDADVVYKVSKEDDVVLYDEGRRNLIVRFETPYFEPANRMVSGRDPETQEPINDWSWRITDIDQLLEKEALE
ncbi:hypothetical protein EC973_003482 [Apophysomyces ossiformis]|uniref:Uncharacterized protein n=1 Tax=Apophysomyces ossiformis TaxID=679940 RepID=A0A8H7BFN7_9FUNG|nr:hypothetical protein EC973_003482 [Apophysomyces ossiformis]